MLKNTLPENRHRQRRIPYPLAAFLIMITALLIFSVPARAEESNETAAEIDLEGTRYYDEAFNVLDIVNKNRTAEGRQNLVMDKALMECAMQRAAELAVYYSHTRPDGTDCFTIVKENGISYSALGENIAAGYVSAEDVMNGWMNSDGHRSNILNGNFKRIGIGVFVHEGIAYWVQLFADGTANQASLLSNVTGIASVDVIPSCLGEAYLEIDLEKKVGKKGTAGMYIANAGWSYVSFTPVSDEIRFSSSKTSVVTVDSSGALKAVGGGKAVISASLVDLPSVSVSETVEISRKNASISFSSSSVTKSCSSAAFTITPEYNGNGTITYSSSDSKVAEVDETTGKVTVKGVGTVKITATASRTSVYNSASAKYTLKVNPSTPKLGKVASAGYNKVKITWSKAKGAGGYNIYQKSDNGWKLIDTVKSDVTSYTHSSLTCGKTYTYTVKAFRKINDTTYKSGYDKNGISGKPVPASPKLKDLTKKSGTSLQLTWEKVSGASGYVVYRKNSSGKWEKIKTITKPSILSFTDKGLKKGTKYTYTVKAYRTVNEKKVYGTYNKNGISKTLK